jgi:hypothetical protein
MIDIRCDMEWVQMWGGRTFDVLMIAQKTVDWMTAPVRETRAMYGHVLSVNVDGVCLQGGTIPFG